MTQEFLDFPDAAQKAAFRAQIEGLKQVSAAINAGLINSPLSMLANANSALHTIDHLSSMCAHESTQYSDCREKELIYQEAKRSAYNHVLEMCNAYSVEMWFQESPVSERNDAGALVQLQSIADGLATTESALQTISSGDLAQAPFPLVGEGARIYLEGLGDAYKDALRFKAFVALRGCLDARKGEAQDAAVVPAVRAAFQSAEQQHAFMRRKAPLPAVVRQRLVMDAKHVRATAGRKELQIDDFEARREESMARMHFELGCWLRHFTTLISRPDEIGLNARIECALRIFLSGITNPSYDFHTVFDFGERDFDAIFEMGDSEAVIENLQFAAKADTTGKIASAIANFGWNDRKH
jgi:hypothetical protein